MVKMARGNRVNSGFRGRLPQRSKWRENAATSSGSIPHAPVNLLKILDLGFMKQAYRRKFQFLFRRAELRVAFASPTASILRNIKRLPTAMASRHRSILKVFCSRNA